MMRLVDDFWTAVIFDLRQPMTAIRGQAQRARKLVFSDPQRADEALAQVVEQIARVDRLLDELRDRVRASLESTTPTTQTTHGGEPLRATGGLK